MRKKIRRTALALPVLATLMTLSACGDRTENTETTQREQPSVEINRQGMDGSTDLTTPQANRGATAIRGGIGNGVEDDGAALDARIATEVRQALERDAALAAMKIDVSSQEGLVTLHGRAPDSAALDRAAEIAGNVKDVKSVENQLTVG